MIGLTALAMDVRSATMWRLGASLNTTLVTGTLVTLVRHSELGGGTPDASQRYRAAALVAVFAGAAVGTLLLRAGLTVALLVAAAGVLAGIVGLRGSAGARTAAQRLTSRTSGPYVSPVRLPRTSSQPVEARLAPPAEAEQVSLRVRAVSPAQHSPRQTTRVMVSPGSALALYLPGPGL